MYRIIVNTNTQGMSEDLKAAIVGAVLTMFFGLVAYFVKCMIGKVRVEVLQSIAVNNFINNDPCGDSGAPGDQTKWYGVDCIYQVFTDQWWPPVKNREDWAGAGDGEAIRYLGICVSKGTISGRVYTERSAWLPYLTFGRGYNINDVENGVLGDGSPIQAIELYYHTPDGYLYKKAVYCVSDMNHEIFYPAQYDNETGNGQDGYAGVKGVAVDKFQAWIE